MNERQRLAAEASQLIMRLFGSCGLMLAALIGAASAQQPAPVESSTPAADSKPGICEGAIGRVGSSGVSERERILLERIERLERRLNEVETRLNATVADGGKARSEERRVGKEGRCGW